MAKTKRIYRCNNCLGKVCSVSIITDITIKFDYQTIQCRETPDKKTYWECIASVKPNKQDLI
jgi:hypothetical protein